MILTSTSHILGIYSILLTVDDHFTVVSRENKGKTFVSLALYDACLPVWILSFEAMVGSAVEGYNHILYSNIQLMLLGYVFLVFRVC